MPNLASTETVDTASTDGTCVYNAAPIGAPNPYVCDDVTGVKINPLSPLPCQPGTRTIRPLVNTTVFINGQLPAVTGDEAQLIIGGSPRPLTGPFQHPKILIGTRLT